MTLNTAQHNQILTDILLDIYNDQELGLYLGFKGGTAAMLFYGLPRFSVDLDFDLLDITKEKVVSSRLHDLLEKYGTIKKIHDGKNGLSFTVAYNNKKDGAYNIKVEVNKKSFGSVYEKKNFLGRAMKVMVQQDMAAHKMVAMLNRIGRTNRDIFDVWYFFKNKWPINKTIIERRTGLKYKEFLEKCINVLDNELIARNVLSGLGELLSEKQKAWVKSSLLSEVTLQLRLAHRFA